MVLTMRFEWDENKNRLNQRKHGITFEFAALVFDDPHAVSHPERFVDGEQRWLTLGSVETGAILVVAHTWIGEVEEVMRIISARKAKPQERRIYEEDRS